jgi:hypothetical protein
MSQINMLLQKCPKIAWTKKVDKKLVGADIVRHNTS